MSTDGLVSDVTATLRRLQEPFHAGDIEWRIMRAEKWGQFTHAWVFPYVTARAVHQRLDDVVGPENWANTPQSVVTVAHARSGEAVLSIQVGISIRIHGNWVTKYNVSEATDVESAKGGFSGAEKRAGSEWGIGRYLYYLDELEAEVAKSEPPRNAGWRYAKLSAKHDHAPYWWRPPRLPAWALPADTGTREDNPPSAAEFNAMKRAWVARFANAERNRSVIAQKFSQHAVSLFGPFPVDQLSGWTRDMIVRMTTAIESASSSHGIDGDVPFE